MPADRRPGEQRDLLPGVPATVATTAFACMGRVGKQSQLCYTVINPEKPQDTGGRERRGAVDLEENGLTICLGKRF